MAERAGVYLLAMSAAARLGFVVLAISTVLVAPRQLPAQAATTAAWLAEKIVSPNETERYTAGIRLRQLERAWEEAEPQQRQEAIPVIQNAVRGYFAGRARDVSSGLDRATAILEGIPERSQDRLQADSLDFILRPALLDAQSTAMLVVRPSYSVKAAPTSVTVTVRALPVADLLQPGNGRMGAASLPRALHPPRKQSPQWTRGGAAGPVVLEQVLLAGRGLNASMPLDLSSVLAAQPSRPTLDLLLLVEVRNQQGTVLRQLGVLLGVADNLEARLAALRTASEDPAVGPVDAVLRETLRHNAQMLRLLAKGTPRETDRPSAGILRAMEVLAAQAPEANRLDALRLAMMASTDRTLTISTLPGALSPALYRVGGDPEQLSPSGLTRALVAIHGAGGSENMFHDAYGLGRLAEWCRQHNRLLIAPRIYSPRDEFWSRLEPLLSQASTTPSLVLVGHSMGSLSSIEMARQRPDLLAGVVAISVGSVQNMEALKGLPVLVAAGQRDFGRHSSRVLYTRLRMAGAKVQWLETPSEHLMVVADALPKAIDWISKLPGASTKPQPKPRTTSQYR